MNELENKTLQFALWLTDDSLTSREFECIRQTCWLLFVAKDDEAAALYLPDTCTTARAGALLPAQIRRVDHARCCQFFTFLLRERDLLRVRAFAKSWIGTTQPTIVVPKTENVVLRVTKRGAKLPAGRQAAQAADVSSPPSALSVSNSVTSTVVDGRTEEDLATQRAILATASVAAPLQVEVPPLPPQLEAREAKEMKVKKEAEAREAKKEDWETRATTWKAKEVEEARVVKVADDYNERVKRHAAREEAEAASRRQEELERRAKIAQSREARAAHTISLSRSGPSHTPRKRRELTRPVRGYDKPGRIEEARQHEIQLKEMEKARVAEQEHRVEVLRKADLIGRGF